MSLVDHMQTGEFTPYHKPFMDRVQGESLAEELMLSLQCWEEIIPRISESQGNVAYAPGKWTTKEVLQHIVDTERVFQYRALSFMRGETQELPGFDHDVFVQKSNCANKSVSAIHREFLATRQASIALFESATPEDEKIIGHCSGYKISVRALGCLMGGHLRHHVQVVNDRYLPQ